MLPSRGVILRKDQVRAFRAQTYGSGQVETNRGVDERLVVGVVGAQLAHRSQDLVRQLPALLLPPGST